MKTCKNGRLIAVPHQVSEFLFGDGFAVAPGDKWRVRRRAVAPSLHKTYLQTMIDRVFGPSGLQLNAKLQVTGPPFSPS
jgi:carotene epsilon-monooxygenase